MKNKSILILIAGNGGAGKSTMATKVAENVQQNENNKEAAVVFQTDYLTNADLGSLSFPYLKNGEIDFLAKAEYMNNVLNFDEDLILDKIKETANKEQTKVVLLEGITSLSFEKIRNFAGLKIYIETDDDIRLIRRIQRRDYYKKLTGQVVNENVQENFRISMGNSLKEEFDLWIERKKLKSMDHDYDKNILAKRKYADLTLVNNHQEDFEKNFGKVIALIDLYFESDEQFKNRLVEESKDLEKHMSDLINKSVDQSQEELKEIQKEKQIWEEEKRSLEQQIRKLQFQIDQQNQEQVAKVEVIEKS